MSLAADLLDQADQLAKLGPKYPKQANLRRAVSAAYYALFHLLVDEAARLFAGLIGRDDTATITRLIRTFDHRGLKEVSNGFKQSRLPLVLQLEGYAAPDDLKRVAEIFVRLQEVRHDADYDTAKIVTREEVQIHIRDVRKAFVAWEKVKATPDARMFLACFSLWKTWNVDRNKQQ